MPEPDLRPDVPTEPYDIFLCTRELPDELTGETAALRQLCSALIGSGFKVFFPSAATVDMDPQQKAAALAGAVQNSRVMVAAVVGDEGAGDQVSRMLWGAFLRRAQEDPSLAFIPCGRDMSALPEEWAGREVLDMADIRFLVQLGERLAGPLPGRSLAAAIPEETPAEEPAPAAEETPAEEPAPAAEETPAEEPAPAAEEAPEEEYAPIAEEAPEEKPRTRKLWLLLAAAAVVVVILIVLLCLKK